MHKFKQKVILKLVLSSLIKVTQKYSKDDSIINLHWEAFFLSILIKFARISRNIPSFELHQTNRASEKGVFFPKSEANRGKS